MFDIQTITPAIMVKNEEYWMYFVLRDVLEVFGKAVILDTGSTDKTKEIIKWFRDVKGYSITLLEEDYGDDANLIGNGRNILRETVSTHWMFLVDGDEIWTLPQLDSLLSNVVLPGIKVCMLGGHNVEDVDGKLLLRDDTAHYDRLFDSGVVWKRTDYPFESYGLGNDYPKDCVHYIETGTVFHWHVRHTRRSSMDPNTYFRSEKYDYYPYEGPYSQLPENWLGETNSMIWRNPYIL